MKEWEKHASIRDWLLAHGYVWNEDEKLGIAWSTRIGMDFTDLEFWPWDRGVDAIIGHHASGTNPRMEIGTCESLEDVIRTHEAIRLINGYKQPPQERTSRDSTHHPARGE